MRSKVVKSTMLPVYRIGVDVGGTNTDAVLLADGHQNSENRGILAMHKTVTTLTVTDGIETAIRNVIAQCKVDRSSISTLIIGTTHFINAVIERNARKLDTVAVIRLSSNFTRLIPPFSDFPPELKHITYGYHAFCTGGCNIDGSEISPLNEDELRSQASKIKALGVKVIVITGVYSPLDEIHKQEYRAREIMQKVYPDALIICSRDISNVGLIERENASILNATILRYAQQTIREFQQVLQRLNLSCTLYLTQNDGTIISAADAGRMPIKTFSSGATNSMRGASYLAYCSSRATASIVIDIGGTTSDAGMLLASGLPRQASAYTDIAGVRVNFPMPHLLSVGLGGGSIVRRAEGGVIVGPRSLGSRYLREARVFGGETLTLSDIMVRDGNLSMGDASLVKDIPSDIVNMTKVEIRKMLVGLVDKIKTSPEAVPVLLVGGGSIIAPSEIPGASIVIRPPFHDVANAVGAAVAKVSATVDTIKSLGEQKLQDIIDVCVGRATEDCLALGALTGSITTAEVETIPIQYMTDKVRVIVKVIGDLDPRYINQPRASDAHVIVNQHEITQRLTSQISESPAAGYYHDEIDFQILKPNINAQREWILNEIDLKFLSTGCYVLGCAGGGSPYTDYLLLRDMLREGHVLRIIEVDRLHDEDVVLWGGYMGSPAVSIERLGGEEGVEAVQDMLDYMNLKDFQAVMSLEIGGSNGLQPLISGSSKFFNRPCIDGDWMGRAYPTYYQTTLSVHMPGHLVPAAIVSGDGQNLIMTKAATDKHVDVALRAACSEMGSRVGLAAKPTLGQHVRKLCVRNTLSLAWRIGRVILECQQTTNVANVADRIIEEVGGQKCARKLFRGRIIELQTHLSKGHTYGSITIGPLSEAESETQDNTQTSHFVRSGGVLRIPFKNENILAEWESSTGEREVIASVPDLICVLDSGNGTNLGVPEFRYGLRVTVICLAASPLWTNTEKALTIGGPKAFGFDVEYKPIGTYVEPKSVIEEFANVAI